VRDGPASRSSVGAWGLRFVLVAGAACLAAFAAAPRPCRAGAPAARAHFIDVGQADSTLLEFPSGAVLIDAGAQDADAERRLISFLDAFFERRADLRRTLAAVVLTHYHVDHVSAIKAVASRFRVARCYDDGNASGSGSRFAAWLRSQPPPVDSVISVRRDDVAAGGIDIAQETLGAAAPGAPAPSIRLLWGGLDAALAGWGAEDFRNENNHSVALRVDWGRASLLFPGDLEEPALAALVDQTAETRLLDADILHVSRHGSRVSTTKQFLDAVSPRMAVVSCGRWDSGATFSARSYGHPSAGTISMLETWLSDFRPTPIQVRVGLGPGKFVATSIRHALYATPWDGTIELEFDTDGRYEISTSAGKHVLEASTPSPRPRSEALPSSTAQDVGPVAPAGSAGAVGYCALAPAAIDAGETAEIDLLLGTNAAAVEQEAGKIAAGRSAARGEVRVLGPLSVDAYSKSFVLTGGASKKLVVGSERVTRLTWAASPKSAEDKPVQGAVSRVTLQIYATHDEADEQVGLVDLDIDRRTPPATRRVETFLGRNWQYLLSTVLIPIGLWTWRRRGRRPSESVVVRSWVTAGAGELGVLWAARRADRFEVLLDTTADLIPRRGERKKLATSSLLVDGAEVPSRAVAEVRGRVSCAGPDGSTETFSASHRLYRVTFDIRPDSWPSAVRVTGFARIELPAPGPSPKAPG
jgi:competence protein ComEC